MSRSRDDAALRSAVAAIWEERRDDIVEQVDLVEEAATDLLAGPLTAERQAAARSAAHKLAGSLGLFGYPAASAHAAAAEELLALPRLAPDDARALAGHVVALRGEVDEAPSVCDDPNLVLESGRRPLLLLVGDPTAFGGTAEAAARRRGFRTEVAPTVSAALRHMHSRTIDVVLIDVDARDAIGSGWDVLERLGPGGTGAAAIIAADATSIVDRLRAVRLGATAFVEKPVSMALALDVAERAVRRARASPPKIVAAGHALATLTVIESALDAERCDVVACDDLLRLWCTLEEGEASMVIVGELPGLDAPDLCRVLRGDARWGRLPLLFLVRGGDGAVARALYRAGADEVLTEPLDADLLTARVGSLLERLERLVEPPEADPLTGVASLARSSDAIDRLLRMASRYGFPVTLGVLDIDDLRGINDRHGHGAGDEVLRRLGDHLRRSFRGEDVAGRWGGDEFVLGLYGMARDDATRRIEAVLRLFREEQVEARTGSITAAFSAGVAAFPADGRDLETLHRVATTALRRAKAVGPGRVASSDEPPRPWEPPDDPAYVDVVIIDDDDAVTDVLRRALAVHGLSTAQFSNGAVAAAAITGARGNVKAGVIILDVDLPGANGFAVLEQLQSAGVLERSRVIMLTGRSDERGVLAALEGGAYDHVAKPFSVPVLVHRILRALRST